MKLSTLRTVMVLCFIGGVSAGLISRAAESDVLMYIAVGLLIASMIANFSQRCPHCGGFIGGKYNSFASYCRYCGERLDDD